MGLYTHRTVFAYSQTPLKFGKESHFLRDARRVRLTMSPQSVNGYEVFRELKTQSVDESVMAIRDLVVLESLTEFAMTCASMEEFEDALK